MKLIFLDVDGVLNTFPERSRFGLMYVCPARIELINNICKATNTSIVLSSTWRKFDRYKAVLKSNGLNWIDQTPKSFGWTRAEEIGHVIKERQPTKFAIIDDLDEAFIGFSPECCFQTNDNDGFLPAMVDRLIAHLEMEN